MDAQEEERRVAFVKCSGTCDKTGLKYNYTGLLDCRDAALAPGGGAAACPHGCLGFGSCVAACNFDAIHVISGAALVDPLKCVGCSACSRACPRGLIEMIPAKASYAVACSSKQKGKDVRAVCEAGCIGCGICAKQCEAGAVTVENNLAHIDQEKCVGCGKCAEKCPRKIIKLL